MKNKNTYGIDEIKEFIDWTFLVKQVLQGKISFWQKIFGRYKKIIKAINEGSDIWKNRDELWKEFKDLNDTELIKVNRYVAEVYGLPMATKDAVEKLIKGASLLIEAYKELR